LELARTEPHDDRWCFWLPDDFDVDADDSCIMYGQGEPIDKAKLEPTNVLTSEDVGFVKDTSVRCQNRASFAGGFGLSRHQQRSSTRNRKLPRIVAALRISRSKRHRGDLGRRSYGRSL
jgi:hypothetical protein